ncbi:MAG: DNA recombination protein RmuC [Fimbriimonadaceae bacterium]|nr:DNA recombination protein RmuC [Fimbriimonadaceae bacterium]
MSVEVVVLIAVVTALVAALLVYIWQQRARRAVETEREAVRGEFAVAIARAADAEKRVAEVSEQLDAERRERGQVALIRERLQTQLQTAEARLLEVQQSLAERSSALEAADRQRTQQGGDVRVLEARVEDLAGKFREAVTRGSTAETQRQELGEQVAQLRAQLATLESERNQLGTQLAEQKTWVEKVTAEFQEKVLAAAAKLMEERGRAFTETNKKEVETIVAPFKESLGEFRQRIDHIYTTDTKERGELRQQIVQLTSLNQDLSKKATDLTHALTVSTKSTGDWGETILHKILEDSGLREGREYTLQHSMKGAEGDTQQPDAVIFLPENRQVVVDSKVSNKAWMDYCNETDEERREQRLKDHLTSLRTHIKGLSSKDYARSPELQTVDFVLMFVPVEAALLTAFSKDDSLYADAYRSKIVLVTPSTLMAVVKLVESMWMFQKRKESADEIAEAGRKLYEKLTSFADTFVDVGSAIEKAHATFEKARGQLSTGKGNAIRLAERMKELGVGPGPGKVMPEGLLEGNEEGDAPEVVGHPDRPDSGGGKVE